MDFIVLGFGLGAIMMVIGIALRDLAPRSHAVGSDRLAWLDVLKRRQRVRWYRGAGRLLILLGGVLASLTLVLLLIDASDSTGTVVLIVAIGLSLVVMASWAGSYAWQQAPQRQEARQFRRLEARMGRSPVAQNSTPAPTTLGNGSREPLSRRGRSWPTPPSPRQPTDATAALAAATEPGGGEQESPISATPEPTVRSREVRPWLADGNAINWRAAQGDRSSTDRQSPLRQSSDDLAAGSSDPKPRPITNADRKWAPIERDAAPTRQPRPADD